jgi:hypothetical protein
MVCRDPFDTTMKINSHPLCGWRVFSRPWAEMTPVFVF